MTMSMSGSAMTSRASATTFAWSPTTALARATSRSATVLISMPRPARRRISSWLRRSTLNVPLPTVPMPSRPTWMGFMAMGSSSCRFWRSSARMPLAVVIEKARDAADRIGEVVGVGQEHEAEVVGRGPVEAGALHDQNLLLGEQLVGELLVVGDRVQLRVEPGEHVQRRLRLHDAHARDLREQLVGQVALPAEPSDRRDQVLDALVAAERGLDRELARGVRAQAHRGQHVEALDV